MVTIEVSFTKEQESALKERARELGLSLAQAATQMLADELAPTKVRLVKLRTPGTPDPEEIRRRAREVATFPDRSEEERPERGTYLERYQALKACASREERVARALSVVGKYASDLTDVGENHDKYFAEAIYERLRG